MVTRSLGNVNAKMQHLRHSPLHICRKDKYGDWAEIGEDLLIERQPRFNQGGHSTGRGLCRFSVEARSVLDIRRGAIYIISTVTSASWLPFIVTPSGTLFPPCRAHRDDLPG